MAPPAVRHLIGEALPKRERSEHLVRDLWIAGQSFGEHERSFDGRVALVREL